MIAVANDLRLLRAVEDARRVAPLVQPSTLLAIVRATLDAADRYEDDRIVADLHHVPVSVIPRRIPVSPRDIVPGCAVWSDQHWGRFRFPHVVQHLDHDVLVDWGDGETSPIDTRVTKKVLIAVNAAEAGIWNDQAAERTGPVSEACTDLDDDAADRRFAEDYQFPPDGRAA